MIWTEYTTPGPDPTRWENVKGTCLVGGIIIVWAIGALLTRNGEWMEKFAARISKLRQSQGN
jgi:hypothetical protein